MYGIKPITIVKNSDMSDDLDILAISSNLKKKPLNKKKIHKHGVKAQHIVFSDKKIEFILL